MDKKNLSIVRHFFANTVFTHKIHEVAAEFQEKNALIIKITNLVLTSIIFVSFILQVVYPCNFFGFLGMLLSMIEFIFLIVQLSFKFDERATLHKSLALKYLGLRNRYTSLITDIMTSDIPSATIGSRRDELLREYQVLCDFAPQTGRSENKETQKRLNKRGVVEGEDFTWSDEEIDRFLPKELRLGKLSLMKRR